MTAFTVGHCLTLFLSGLELVRINAETVEFLIPLTILLSCINNYWLILKGKRSKQQLLITYIILLVFGLIHGLGFSNYIKRMIFDDESIVMPLFGFNVGIELAQLLIIAVFLILISLVDRLIKGNVKWARIVVNSLIFFLVLKMMF